MSRFITASISHLSCLCSQTMHTCSMLPPTVQLVQDSFTTYMRLLPFGWATVALPPSDPYWSLDGNVSVFQQDFSRADALRTVELNSTTFSYVAIASEPPKITVRVPIFIGACFSSQIS